MIESGFNSSPGYSRMRTVDSVPSRDLEYLALGWGTRANFIFSNFKSTEEFLLSKIKIIWSRFALYRDHYF